MSESRKIVLRDNSSLDVRVNTDPLVHGEPYLMVSAGEYRVYDELIYHYMSTDEPRTEMYERAIARFVDGKTVLDIGTGIDVNWALEAIKCGASIAYAMEEMESSFQGAEATIVAAGMSDKIHLLKGNSTEVSLPEKVDVCISEIIGMIGGAEGAAAVLRDATSRYLKPGGKMIPARCITRIAAATLPENLHRDPSMHTGGLHYLGAVLRAVGHAFDPRMSIGNYPLDHILSTDDIFEDLDFENITSLDYQRNATLEVVDAGRMDGFLLYLHLWCDRDADYLDCLEAQTSWCPIFFPVFYPGIWVEPGDLIELVCEGSYGANGALPDYKLSGTLQRQGHTDQRFAYASPYNRPEFRTVPFFQRLFS